MGIAIIGSVSQYTRTMKMTMDWKQKKESGNYTKKSDEKTSELDHYRRQLEEIRENAKEDKSAIYMKLKNGKKLTAEELEYLRDHDPEAYKEAKEIEAEQKRYEEELKRCKTKEDVDALKMTYLSSKMAVAKEIANNPNIPKGAKMQLLLKENAKIKAAQEAELRFKSSSQYANLPTAEEKAEETEEKRAELRGEPEKEEAAIRAEEEKDREESPGTQEGEHVPEEVPEQRESHVSAAEKEIHWIDLRDAAESPRTEREYVREAYRREMEAETNTEFREKNRGKH
ncbi:MAG: hypothetical protein HFG69_08920 [Hungatella sp.]|nr:hypothetical protein [Hungatella sp.]